MKKYLFAIAVLVGIIFLVGGLLGIIKREKDKREKASLRIDQSFSEESSLALEERPYVTLVPRSDGHELKLKIRNLKDIQFVEYELVYFAGDVSRGVIGAVPLNNETSFSRDLLLGTCSKNVCKYDEGVREGTLTLRLKGNSGNQKYEIPFRLQIGKEAKVGLSSQDGNFIFQGNLPSSTFYLVQETLGLPETPPGKVIAGPYGIFTGVAAPFRGTIELKLKEIPSGVKILGWDETSWKEYSSGFEIDKGTVSVEVDKPTTFVAISL